MNPIRTLVPIVLVASAIVASPAIAQSQTRAVSYADLDLTSSAGQAALDRRIENAVRQVCGNAFPIDLQSQQQVRRCRAETLSSARAQRNDAFAQAQINRVQLSSR